MKKDYVGQHIKKKYGSSVLCISRFHKRKHKPKLSKKEFLIKKAIELRNHPTMAETVFKNKLENIGINFIFQYYYNYVWEIKNHPNYGKRNKIHKQHEIENLSGIVDFYLPDQNLFIEIDGGYHDNLDQKQKDAIKDWLCQQRYNIKVIRITNEQAINLTIDDIKKMIFSCAVAMVYPN